MDNIFIESTPKTPKVSFHVANGTLEITGRSIPENSYQFYEPLLEWLDRYDSQAAASTVLTFKLDYFNTSSSMYILGILKKIEKIFLAGKQVSVSWFYDQDDEDMLQTGEDLKQIVKVPVNIVQLQS